MSHFAQRHSQSCDEPFCAITTHNQRSITIQLNGDAALAEDDVFEFGDALIEAIISGLDSRFSEESLVVLNAFKIFDPASYVGLKYEQLDNSFQTEFHVLLKQFCKLSLGEDALFRDKEGGWDINMIDAESYKVGVGKLLDEFLAMKQHIHYKLSLNPGVQFGVFWKQVYGDSTKPWLRFRHVMHFLHAMYIFCGDAATVERGFSLHASTKTPKRNRLDIFTLDGLMRVKLLTEGVSYKNFNYEKAKDLHASSVPAFITSKLFSELLNTPADDPQLDSFDASQHEFFFSTEESWEGEELDLEGLAAQAPNFVWECIERAPASSRVRLGDVAAAQQVRGAHADLLDDLLAL